MVGVEVVEELERFVRSEIAAMSFIENFSPTAP